MSGCKLRNIGPLIAQHTSQLNQLRNRRAGEPMDTPWEPNTTQECVRLIEEIQECACTCRPETRGGEGWVIAAKNAMDSFQELHKEIVCGEGLERFSPAEFSYLTKAGVYFPKLNKLFCELTSSHSQGLPTPGTITVNCQGETYLQFYNTPSADTNLRPPILTALQLHPPIPPQAAPAPEAASNPAEKELPLPEAPAPEQESVLPAWLTSLQLSREQQEKFLHLRKFISQPDLEMQQRLYAALVAELDVLLVKKYSKMQTDRYMAEFCGDPTKTRDAAGCRCRYRNKDSGQDDRYDLKAKYPDFEQRVREHLNL